MASDGKTVWVTNEGSNDVSAVDLASGKTTTIAVGNAPRKIVVQPVAAKAAAAGGATVSIANFAFAPTPISVAAGSTVTWSNDDGAPHALAFADGAPASDLLLPGQRFSRTFAQAGTLRLRLLGAPVHGAERSRCDRSRRRDARRRLSSGQNQIAIVSAPSAAAIGRLKKASTLPSALIIDETKFSSSMAPRTTPRISGVIGKPFSSSSQATRPATSMMPTSNAVLLIANAPTMQNSRITGIRMSRGTRRIRLATLMQAQPSGSMIRLAMMKSR